ncbi:O-antigen ligase family protein [Pseudoalteromonas sp. TB64]|uniref:O-antigen ligase family protein n=1 Tax=Pseudoalteromonas sp. TB64 TaxID=1938600 RepID=UPI00040E9786|nr:O-antigen ligase family protein [Pseudoalteromonas sp. TB64]
MAYISSLIIILMYFYTLRKLPYIKSSKLFLGFFTLFVVRIIFSINHVISFKPIFAGQSLTSLSSLCTIFLVFTFMDKKYLRYKFIIPYYLIVISIFISAIYSGEFMGGVVVLMKWLLLIVTSIALIQLFFKHGLINTLKPFYYLFLGLFICQLASVVLGQGKDTEALNSTSNSISYIAGYAHESAFSILLYTGLLISSVLMLKKDVKPIVPFLFIIGLVFANYRTLLISALIPLFCVYFAHLYMGSKKEVKLFVFSSGAISLLVFGMLFGVDIADRFGELGGALSNLGELMSIDYSLFSFEERRLLSSRLFLWNMYLTEYSHFTFFGMLLGAGPEAWTNYFDVYAHNAYIAALFDLGIIGLCVFLGVLYSTFVFMLKIKDKKLKIVVLGFLAGFLVMSSSTMPLWAVEGVHLYSFIFTIAYYLSTKIFSDSNIDKIHN